jgi:HAD superfamily hydrolase (TIGR01509 family)
VTGALEALVFDFDGLILDTETPQFHTVAAAFTEYGVELDLADWQDIVGTADHPHWSEMLADALGERADAVDFDEVRQVRQVDYHGRLAELVPLPGVIELVEAAAAQGLGLAVASSSPLDWVDGHLTRLGLRGHFSSLHTRDHVERTKPAPDLFQRAVKALDVDAARSVALEDSPHGVTAARAAGMAVVACPNEVTRGQPFDFADLVVDSLATISLDDLAGLLRFSG